MKSICVEVILLSKNLTAKITVVNNCKKIIGTSFNSNSKVSNSRKSDEKILEVKRKTTEFLLKKVNRKIFSSKNLL